MLKMTIPEFEETCRKLKPCSFTFDSALQLGDDFADSLHVVEKYSRMRFMLNPNGVTFIGNDCVVDLSLVDYIECSEDFREFGGEFVVVCRKYWYDPGSEMRWRMCAELSA